MPSNSSKSSSSPRFTRASLPLFSQVWIVFSFFPLISDISAPYSLHNKKQIQDITVMRRKLIQCIQQEIGSLAKIGTGLHQSVTACLWNQPRNLSCMHSLLPLTAMPSCSRSRNGSLWHTSERLSEHILGICPLLHMQNTDFLYHIRIQLYGILYFLFTFIPLSSLYAPLYRNF